MKLKKIVSLALAGVLAVSMLAGCNYDGAASSNGGASSEAPAATGMVGKVIAALDESVTDKVTFTAGDKLQAAMDYLAKDAANSALATTVSDQNLADANPSLGSKGMITTIQTDKSNYTTANGTDSKAETKIYVVTAKGTNEDLVADLLAAEVADVDVYNDGSDDQKIAGLPDCSNRDESNKYRFDFEYTGTMGVVSSTNATTGEVTYVLAFTLTRTPSKYEFHTATQG